MRTCLKLFFVLPLFLIVACGSPVKQSEVVYEPTPPDTMLLDDGNYYEIIPIDDLFSTFCCGSDQNKDYYMSFSFIVKSRVDTLIMNDSYFDGRNNLVTHDLDEDNYDSGFFLFEGDEPFEWFQSKEKGDVVLIKCNIKSPHYQGMLGADVIFENCLILEE